MRNARRLVVPVFVLTLSVLFAPGCGTTSAQQTGSGGAALGAIAGGLITGNWRGAAAGAAIGGGLGYIAGNEQDKAMAQEQANRDRAAMNAAYVTQNPQTAYRPPNRSSLVGSTWRVISLVSDKPVPTYHSIVVTFQTNTNLTTLTVDPQGKVQTTAETYRIVDDVIIITTKEKVINAKWSVSGNQLIIVAADLRIVMEEV
jgi:hypothetical protein